MVVTQTPASPTTTNDTESGDKAIQFTLAFNHFGCGLFQRMPMLRWGFAHVVNNDYTHWEMYAIDGNFNPTILR
ncbi:Probable pectate lyase 19 [Linum perenne]